MDVIGEPRHRRRGQDRGQDGHDAGVIGNQRMTAMTGLVLLVLFAIEGFTLLSVHQLIAVHFFVGMLILGPAALKIGATCYRFARYYTRSQPYVRKGPPAPLLRVIGPVMILSSLAVLGTGVMLAVAGPAQDGGWLLAHKVAFFVWFGAMTIHVLYYAPRLPRLLAGPRRGRSGAPQGRAGGRYLLLAGSLLAVAVAAGAVLALATVHLAGSWNPAALHPHL